MNDLIGLHCRTFFFDENVQRAQGSIDRIDVFKAWNCKQQTRLKPTCFLCFDINQHWRLPGPEHVTLNTRTAQKSRNLIYDSTQYPQNIWDYAGSTCNLLMKGWMRDSNIAFAQIKQGGPPIWSEWRLWPGWNFHLTWRNQGLNPGQQLRSSGHFLLS